MSECNMDNGLGRLCPVCGETLRADWQDEYCQQCMEDDDRPSAQDMETMKRGGVPQDMILLSNLFMRQW